jgi:hypothetical protein
MQDLQQIIVNEHIGDLRREAEAQRSERRMRHRTREGDSEGARVRLGHWLIGVGTAVAGPAGDPGSAAPSVR